MKKLIYLLILLLTSVILLSFFGESIYSENDSKTNSNIYTYTYNGLTFESHSSLDDAFMNAMKYHYELGLIDMEGIQEEYIKISSRDIIEEPCLNQPTRGTALTGKVQWMPNSNPNTQPLPLQRVKVELFYDSPGQPPIRLDTTYTNDNGEYMFDDYFNWGSIISAMYGYLWNVLFPRYSVKILPEGETFRVSWNCLISGFLYAVQDWIGGGILELFPYTIGSSTFTCIWNTAMDFGTLTIPYVENNWTTCAFLCLSSISYGRKIFK